MAMLQIKTYLSPKQKILAVLLFFLAMLGVIIFFIIAPAVKEIRGLNAQIYNQRLSLEKKYTERFGMRKVVKNFKEINDDFSKAASIYIPPNGELDFITSIEDIADKNNVNLKIFLAPQEKNEYPDGIQSFDLTLTAIGDFQNIIGFINEIEKHDIYILINDISILNKIANKGKLEASLKGYVYKNINL